MLKNETHADFVAVHGFQNDLDRITLRVEIFDLDCNGCFGLECIESGILSSIQHP
jgi:hypothetical protein